MNNSSNVKKTLFHWSVYTEIEINATKEMVWKFLTDFDTMPNWSTSLQKIEGDFHEGGTTNVFYLFRGKVIKFKATMIDFENGTQFGWSEPTIPLAKDRHFYRLESLPNGKTKFIQSDEIKGFSALFIGKMIAETMVHNFTIFNNDLKEQIEKLT